MQTPPSPQGLTTQTFGRLSQTSVMPLDCAEEGRIIQQAEEKLKHHCKIFILYLLSAFLEKYRLSSVAR
jgi:hypothetical protein